ncbi:hypothetical protein BCS96_11435 [Vibrio breoganii]|uniref:hypothetical protein n=1 Tax=Vibrio breoganii TaxID=553239 RepID=UPI000C83880C|nr:hypothetical protein [Vibrio breoganii]PMG31204.1 hypothetical protein BCU93_07395 [Vibrio breoganii]PMG90239.1 hypothetical protein BCU81_06875 [Vibrio breoganii]PML84852.1 hypothetical protein BCT68_00565 [Vibrio breoganii]PMM44960.1 hypothetical protein BCT52_09955 [Vibrio breoganii]PMO92317.1 hypothetical protein BCS98_10050 [Vibrio breoganii]
MNNLSDNTDVLFLVQNGHYDEAIAPCMSRDTRLTRSLLSSLVVEIKAKDDEYREAEKDFAKRINAVVSQAEERSRKEVELLKRNNELLKKNLMAVGLRLEKYEKKEEPPSNGSGINFGNHYED